MTEAPEGDDCDIIGRALASLGVGVWSWRHSPAIVHCCAVTAHLFDVPAADGMMGVPLQRFAAHVHPDDRCRFAEAIDQAQRRGGSFGVEYRTMSARGEVRRVLDRGEFTMGASGLVVAANGLVVDMTDRSDDSWIQENPFAAIGFESLSPLEQAAEHALALYRLVGVMPDMTGRLAATLAQHLVMALGQRLADRTMPPGYDGGSRGGSRTLN